MATWDAIETAPKDGTPVLLYRPAANFGEWDQLVIARWHHPISRWVWPSRPRNDGWWEDEEFFDMIEEGEQLEANNFTHWQEKPQPPKLD